MPFDISRRDTMDSVKSLLVSMGADPDSFGRMTFRQVSSRCKHNSRHHVIRVLNLSCQISALPAVPRRRDGRHVSSHDLEGHHRADPVRVACCGRAEWEYGACLPAR